MSEQENHYEITYISTTWKKAIYRPNAYNIINEIESSHLGSMSHPCCMKAPSENQRLLKIVKLLVTVGPSVLSSICHSKGLNRLTRKSTTLTPIYAKITHIQISYDKGYMNENTPGISLVGLWIMMLIPRLMKGLEKSITLSRLLVMVSGATAKSASYNMLAINSILFNLHSIQ